MSAHTDHSQPSLGADAADAQAAAWLERAEFATADQATLEAWLAESWQHRVAYWRMKAVWNETNRFAALRSPGPMKKAQAPTRRTISWSFFAKSAAAAALVVSIGGTALFMSKPAMQTFATELGARKTLTLPDGSQIELNTNTKIRIADDHRSVWLDKGEAYFQIKHDAAHPFSVTVGNRRVLDLGTKFVIRHDADNIRVTLIEGRAEIKSDDASVQSAPVVLDPGDVATASRGVLSVEKRPDRELKDELGWRTGLLIFYHTTLADAATEFNRYNRQKLIIADKDIAQRRINGTFMSNNVEVFGHVAQAVLGLNVQNTENEIVISR